jgi:amino acid adenylation domain-containing protein
LSTADSCEVLMDHDQATDFCPLSFGQERLWLLDRLGSEARNEYLSPVAWRVRGVVDVGVLVETLAAVVGRHDAVRTRFVVQDGVPRAVVDPFGSGERLDVEVLDALGEGSEAARLQAVVDRELGLPFDLQRQWPLRCRVIRCAADVHVVLAVFHHIACDGWSLSVFARDLAEFYAAGIAGREPRLPELPWGYADFARHQRRSAEAGGLREGLRYWTGQLAGSVPTELPSVLVRPPTWSSAGATQQFVLEAEVADRLRELARSQRASLFMVLLAGFYLALHQLTGRTDLVVGTPIAGRDRPETTDLIGFFINTLPLRVQLDPQAPFSQLLHQVRECCLNAYTHADTPFDKIVDALNPHRDLSRNPLFQLMFSLDAGMTAELQLGTATVEHFPVLVHSPMFDAAVEARTAKAQPLTLTVNYATAVVDGSDVEALGRCCEQTWVAMSEWTADSPIQVALDDAELASIQRFERGGPTTATADGVVAWFDRQASSDGGRSAITEQDRSATYAQLRQLSCLISDWLAELGLPPSSVIGIAHDRGITQVALIMGVLRAGLAYLPLDPREPAGVLRASMTAASVALVLYDARTDLSQKLDLAAGTATVDGVDSEAAFVADRPWPLPNHTPAPTVADQLAYVIRTSGSTGEPKAVAVPLSALSNRVAWGVEHFQITDADRLLYKTAPTFDAAQWEIFGTLCSGAELVVAPVGVELDGGALGEFVRRHEVTLLQLVPTVLRLVLDAGVLADCASLRWVFVAGEVLTATDIARFADQSDARLTNTYGPSECAIDVTAWDAAAGHNDVVPIGTPISGVSVQLLDSQYRRVPAGAIGQIAIGGVAVGWGYLNQPATTARCFVPDPDSGPGARRYLTGDLGRWGPDGNLYFIGRAEDETKVNGVRTNLAGLEAVVLGSDLVRSCAMVVTPSETNLSSLSLFWTGQPAAEPALRAFLQDNLGMAFRPRQIVHVEGDLPKLPSGKVDRKKLSTMEIGQAATGTQAGGSDEVTDPTGLAGEIAAVWRRLLGDPTVGADDDFFASGGTSLQAVAMAHQLSDTLRREVNPRDIYLGRTIAGLVTTLTAREASGAVADLPAAETVSTYEPSFGQERLWLLDRLGSEARNEYLSPVAWRVRGVVDVGVLVETLAAVVGRHDAVRTRFVVQDGVPRAVVDPFGSGERLDVEVLDALGEGSEAARLQAVVDRELGLPFDLQRQWPLRCRVIRCAADVHVVLAVFHHIACDGWSLSVFARDLAEFYAAGIAGREPRLPELPWGYADFARHQRRSAEAGGLREGLRYWTGQLAGSVPTELPSVLVRPPTWSSAGATQQFVLEAEVADRLRELARSQRASLFMVLLAGFYLALHQLTGRTDLVVGTPIAGRDRPETTDLIGFFINTLPLRVQLDPQAPFSQLLHQVRECCLNAYTHADTPFDKIVDALNPHRDLSRNPLFQLMFSLEEREAESRPFSTPDPLEWQAQDIVATTTKVDASMVVVEGADSLRVDITCATSVLTVEESQALLDAFIAVLVELSPRTTPDARRSEHHRPSRNSSNPMAE